MKPYDTSGKVQSTSIAAVLSHEDKVATRLEAIYRDASDGLTSHEAARLLPVKGADGTVIGFSDTVRRRVTDMKVMGILVPRMGPDGKWLKRRDPVTKSLGIIYWWVAPDDRNPIAKEKCPTCGRHYMVETKGTGPVKAHVPVEPTGDDPFR